MDLFFVSVCAAAVDAASTDQCIISEKQRRILSIQAHALLHSVHQNVLHILPLCDCTRNSEGYEEVQASEKSKEDISMQQQLSKIVDRSIPELCERDRTCISLCK